MRSPPKPGRLRATLAVAVAALATVGGPAAAGPLAYLEAALANNLSYQQAQLAVPEAEQGLEVARRIRQPQLRGSASYQFQEPEGRDADKLSAQIVATQELIDFENSAGVELARTALDLAHLDVRAAEQDVLLGTYKAYLGAALAQESIGVLAKRGQTLAEQLKIAESNLELGRATRLQVLNVKAQIAALEAERIDAANDLTNALDALAQLAGVAAGDVAGLSRSFELPLGSMAQWLRQAEDAPELLAATKRVELAELAVEQLKGSVLPSLALRGTADKRLNPKVNLDLTVPLYSSGAATASLARAELAIDAAKLARRSQLQARQLQIRQSHRSLAQLAARIEALAVSVAVERERLALALASIELASGVQADATNASADLASAELRLIQARHLQLEAWLGLLAATGQLTLEAAAKLEVLFT